MEHQDKAMVSEEERCLAAVWLSHFIRPIDYLFNKTYSSKYNPLYQSGVLALGLLGIVILTGVYLLFFYKISDPYGSMMFVQSSPYLVRWVRSLHRYASDLAMVAVFFHVIRMFIQGKSWGPRTLAWVSGVILTGLMFFCAWTGLILVWDVQGQVVATHGARVMDLFPFFAEPVTRSFVEPGRLPRSFFFLNLFLHTAFPIAMIFCLWLHTSRLARPKFFPPKSIFLGSFFVLLLLAIVYPAPLSPSADLLAIPDEFPINWFYGFWIPLAQKISPLGLLLFWLLLIGFLLLIPWISRPSLLRRPSKSVVHEKSCTGCTTCYYDCPFEAISMIKREQGIGSEYVARVNSDLCVSCGICAGSCSPMGVGPPLRTGRDQLKKTEHFLKLQERLDHKVVLVYCRQSLQTFTDDRFVPYPVACSGNLHSSVIEQFINQKAKGVFIATCPDRDCWHREGPKHLHARVYEGRESELRKSVDRRRIFVGHYGPAEEKIFQNDLLNFFTSLEQVQVKVTSENLDIDCEPKPFVPKKKVWNKIKGLIHS